MAVVLLGATAAGARLQILDERPLRPWLAAAAGGWLLVVGWRARRPLSPDARRGLLVVGAGLLVPWLALVRGGIRLFNGALDAGAPLEAETSLVTITPGDGAVELTVGGTARYPSRLSLRQRDPSSLVGLGPGDRVKVVTHPGKLGLEWCDGRCVRPIAAANAAETGDQREGRPPK
jgi:hypothetical protein